MKRHAVLELLDTDSGTEQEVRASLADLRWFNRWFGGLSTLRALLTRVSGSAQQTNLSLLEVGAGEGYLPGAVNREFEPADLRLNIVLLDRCASHLPLHSSLPKVAGDALRLPFRDASFDLVCSSLFLHHLTPETAVSFVREALRVSKLAVLVHDLIRHPLHLALAYLGTPLSRSRITRNDAPASVRQAYTVEAVRGLCERAGAVKIEIEEHYLFRMGAIAWK
jgi:ubiquinone/menaquinone biosynthesis C-methylase UbiE